MVVLGVDPSSSVTGLALVEDDELLMADIFSANPEVPMQDNLHDFFRALSRLHKQPDGYPLPDIVVVEKVSVSWNVNTIRKIAYFEAVAMLYTEWLGHTNMYNAKKAARAIQVQATKARRIVLGKGNLSKEACHEIVTKELKPDREWRPPNKGGMDETDAYVLALAGPALADGA